MKHSHTCSLLLLIALQVAVAGCQPKDTETSTARELFRGEVLKLVEAAEAGDAATIDQLIQQGVDVNAQGWGKVTPLHRALYAGNKTGYSTLLKQGADPNLLDHHGNAVMHLAAEIPDSFWLEEALQNGGDPNVINIGHRFWPKRTPIYYAIYKGQADNLSILIRAGADLSYQDDYGFTPVRAASETKISYEVIYRLLVAGADYRIEDNHKRNVIDVLSEISRLPAGVLPEENQRSFDKVNAFFMAEGIDLSKHKIKGVTD